MGVREYTRSNCLLYYFPQGAGLYTLVVHLYIIVAHT